MAKVICTLPNASTCINGIGFAEHALGMLSEEMEQEEADAFLRIKGYRNHEEGQGAALRADPPAPAPAPRPLPKKK